MRYLFLAMTMVFSFGILAETQLVTRIHNIDFGDNLSEDILVYLSSGKIARLSTHELELSAKLHQGLQNKSSVTITLNDDREILSVEEAPYNLPEPTKRYQKSLLNQSYIPSVIGSMTQARNFFYESLHSPNDSQCFNRAHVWAHEWRIKHNLYSNKVWVFFTRNYIRKFAFEWWFHVSPYVHVVEDGKVRERVMDVKYSRGPVNLKQWTDIFLRDDAPCPVVEKYSDHANYPEHGSCFLMKSSMYYYQPVDLEWKEFFEAERNTWVATEVVQAYMEAFNIDLNSF